MTETQRSPISSWPLTQQQTRTVLASIGVDLEAAPVRCDLRRVLGVVLLRDLYGATVVGPMRRVDAVLALCGVDTVDCTATT